LQAELMQLVKHERLKRAFIAHGIRGYWRKYVALYETMPHSSRDYHGMAEISAKLGQKDKAFKQLWAPLDARDHRVTQLKVNPVFDSLRSDSRFAELMERMNLEP
jgi:hypothetical protein